jgi:putative transposase
MREVLLLRNSFLIFGMALLDHEGEVLESFATKERDKKAALKFMKTADETAWLRQDNHH